MSPLLDEHWTFQRVAHRGFRGHYAENTLLAFEKAIEVGATMVELDVRLTKDEVPVVLHDPTLMRLGKHHAQVSDFLWEDLREIELHDAEARHVQAGRVLSVDELLTTIGDRCNYYMEIKTSRHHSIEHAHHLCNLLVALVAKHNMQEKTLFATFQFYLLQYLTEQCNPYRVGYNFEKQWLGLASVEELQAMNALLCPDQHLLTRERFDEAKAEGFRIIPWVVNSPIRMHELLNWGVDGITTDYPDRFEKVFPS